MVILIQSFEWLVKDFELKEILVLQVWYLRSLTKSQHFELMSLDLSFGDFISFAWWFITLQEFWGTKEWFGPFVHEFLVYLDYFFTEQISLY